MIEWLCFLGNITICMLGTTNIYIEMNGNLVLSQPKNLEINQPSIWVWTSTWGFFEAIFTAWLRHAAFEDSVIRFSPILMEDWLVVSTPLKNISQNGNLPQVRMKIKNIWNYHLEEILAIFRWKLFLSFKFENWGRELGTGHNDSIISYIKIGVHHRSSAAKKPCPAVLWAPWATCQIVDPTAQLQGREKHTFQHGMVVGKPSRFWVVEVWCKWGAENANGRHPKKQKEVSSLFPLQKLWHVQHLRCKYMCVCVYFLW